MQILAHELKHGHQYLMQEIDFDKSGRHAGFLYDITDEIAALNRQNLFSDDVGATIVHPAKYAASHYGDRKKGEWSFGTLFEGERNGYCRDNRYRMYQK
ncbi:MAG: hypothetical protein LBR36_09670 [Bacteroidales bacterium]|nr:hypothetical protein [Bacteroidales bacterium]